MISDPMVSSPEILNVCVVFPAGLSGVTGNIVLWHNSNLHIFTDSSLLVKSETLLGVQSHPAAQQHAVTVKEADWLFHRLQEVTLALYVLYLDSR